MKKSRFTEEQIIGILREADGQSSIKSVCAKHNVSEATFYAWKKKYPAQLCEHVSTGEAMGFLARADLLAWYRPEGHPASLDGKAVFFQRLDDRMIFVLHGLQAELSQVPSQP